MVKDSSLLSELQLCGPGHFEAELSPDPGQLLAAGSGPDAR